MQTSTVVELRSAQSVLEAARYSQEQLRAHIELGLADSRTRPPLDALLALIESISFGQEHAVLMRHLDVLTGAMSKVASIPVAQHKPVSFEAIEAELQRRARKRQEIGNAQEAVLNERDPKRERLTIVTQLVKHGVGDLAALQAEKKLLDSSIESLTKTIDLLATALSDNDRKVSQLVTYRTAKQMIENGLPAGIIGHDYEL